MSEIAIRFQNVLDTPYAMEMLAWRNQAFVRENMLDDLPIPEERHLRYLEALRRSGEQKVFLAFWRERPAAVMTMKHLPGAVETGSYLIREEDRGKGLGVITGWARMEYVFRHMPEGEMRTAILAHNVKNRRLQESFGCRLDRVTWAEKSDGAREELYCYSMDRPAWEARKEGILRLIDRLVPVEQIRWIEE